MTDPNPVNPSPSDEAAERSPAPRKRTFRAALPGVRLFTRSTVLAIAFVAALVLNVATLTIAPVFNALSSVVGTVGSLVAGRSMTVRAAHTQRVTALRQHNQALSRRLGNATRVNIKARQTAQRIARRTVIATARNTGSIAAEAIPYIGIAAIVAATAMELNDACETMNDLHELERAIDPETADGSDAAKVCGAAVPSKEEILDMIRDSPSTAWAGAKDLYDKTPDLPSLPAWDEMQTVIGKGIDDVIAWWATLLE